MAIFGFFFFLLIFCWLSWGIIADQNDFRYISYQDLQLSFDKFSQDGVTAYSQILFDAARRHIFVGARDNLFRLGIEKLNLIENAVWNAPEEKTTQCIEKGQDEENCHNYIKVLLLNGNELFVCGTNAFSPRCTWRDTENLSQVRHWVDGVAKCPYNPLANVTGLMTSNGDYYFGGSTDFSASDYLISRSTKDYNALRTKQYNSMWLNEPQFVSSFETDSFVYFLFREAAVEYINCGKIVYSRIARICKNDPGGRTMLKDNWTTFVKARLNCSISGDYPFYFDEIQGTTYVPEENIIYATFQTPSNSIAGSAICAFNLTSIDAAFAGPFKYQEHTGSSWNKHYTQYQNHFECKGSAKSSHLLETSKYQLMDNAVQATSLSPLHVAQGERFTHITVDVLATKMHTRTHVIYVSTQDGLIKKLTVLPYTQETCVVEVWQPVPSSSVSIQQMQFYKESNSIYVGTDVGVLRIPTHHCKRHVSRDSCLNAMDPYCGWNELKDACTPAPEFNPLVKHWKQTVNSCPVLDASVDGGWSSWSDWAPCSIRNSDPESSDTCLCQTRTCNNPAPQNDGLVCTGETIAVTNCTMHGGWTPWSAWSSCSATCGIAVKTRSRTCTNPAPAHGGRVCVGQDHSEVLCAGNPPCPISTAPPQDGGWGEWESWGPCSSPCGGGFRKRHRVCNNPMPKYGGIECLGCSIEFDICNTHSCLEQRKQGSWTPWLLVNNVSNEYTEKRYKFSCKGPVQDSTQLKINVREEKRTCSGGFCSSPLEEIPRGSTWSSWSECTNACGGGIQNRTKFCDGRDCQGFSTQTRACNTHPCQNEWACWSDWSPCSTTCGWGVKKRFRKCLGQGCEGLNMEEEPCENASCESLLGWDGWSAWSLCDENKEQHRKRKCRTSNPSPQMCRGSNVEMRMCVLTDSDLETANLELEAAALTPGVIIAFILVGFIIGLLCAFAMIYFYQRKKRPRLLSSPQYINAKQNPYITVPLRDRPSKSTSSSNNILNNIHNGTLKSKCYDHESGTLKRNSHGLNNGHTKQDLIMGDDKLYYD